MTLLNHDPASDSFAARDARGGATWRHRLILLLLLFVIGTSQALAQADAVYVTRWKYVAYGTPAYDGLWVYRWPDLALQTVDRTVPEHRSSVVSVDGREIYLLSLTRVDVLDRQTRQVLRSFPAQLDVDDPFSHEMTMGGFISPLRPELLILSRCHWIDVRAGRVVRTPATLVPGYTCANAHLDDSGQYVVLAVARFAPGQAPEYALRIVNLDGEDILGRNISGYIFGAILGDGRIVVGNDRPTNGALQVLDRSTLMPVAQLPLPPNSSVLDIHGDGHGALLALIRAPDTQLIQLLRWRTVPGEPEVVFDGVPYAGGYPRLRAQRGHVEYHSRVFESGGISTGDRFIPGGERVRLFDFDRGIIRELIAGPDQVITDIALAPLAFQSTSVPVNGPVALMLMTLGILGIGWRRRVRRGLLRPG